MILSLGIIAFGIARGKAKAQLENNEPLRSMPVYHGLYVSLWTMLPSIFLVILFLIFNKSIFDFLITPFISASTISLGLDEVIYAKNFLISNISNLNNLTNSEFLSNEMALSLYDRYTQGRMIAFGSFIILSITFLSVTRNKLSVRFDA